MGLSHCGYCGCGDFLVISFEEVALGNVLRHRLVFSGILSGPHLNRQKRLNLYNINNEDAGKLQGTKHLARFSSSLLNKSGKPESE